MWPTRVSDVMVELRAMDVGLLITHARRAPLLRQALNLIWRRAGKGRTMKIVFAFDSYAVRYALCAMRFPI